MRTWRNFAICSKPLFSRHKTHIRCACDFFWDVEKCVDMTRTREDQRREYKAAWARARRAQIRLAGGRRPGRPRKIRPAVPIRWYTKEAAFRVLCRFAKSGRMEFSFQTFVRHLQREYGGPYWRRLRPLTTDEAQSALLGFTGWITIAGSSARGRPSGLKIDEAFLIYMTDYDQ